MVKENLKHKAIEMRRAGRTYSEILKVVPVAKSTISFWLREVGLSVPQKQKITLKRMRGQRKGARARKQGRLLKSMRIIKEARSEVGLLSKRERWLVGTALYWAEGSKQKNNTISAKCSFSNTDPAMINVFLRWLQKSCGIALDDIQFSIHLHENSVNSVELVRAYWSKKTMHPMESFERVYFKKNKIKTNRQNIGKGYYGILRIDVRRSTDFVRKIAGWCQGIDCGIV